jgi:lipoyl(octanoyl) transferase
VSSDEPQSLPPLSYTWLGRLAYQPALALQEQTRTRVLAGEPDAERILFVEHEPVATLGRSATSANLRVPPDELARRGVELVRSSRGGDVTAHGPGQLVIYPIVRLRHGVAAHVCRSGEAIAEELRARGVARAHFRRDPVGVFVGDAKIAACGVHVSRRVAIHGWALNVTRAPLALFALIVPCGLADVRVTTIEDELDAPPPSLASLCAPLAERIARALAHTSTCARASESI